MIPSIVRGSVLLIPCGALLAQSPTPRPSMRVGVTTGVNWATLAGKDAFNESRRTAFRLGGLVVLPMTANLAFQPELIFTLKGSVEGPQGSQQTFAETYFELPLLVRYQMTAGRVKPFVYAGPSVAHDESCNMISHDANGTNRVPCSEIVFVLGGTFNKWDAGVVVGTGLALDVGGRVLTVSARYDHGLRTVETETDLYHRVVSLVATFEVPFTKVPEYKKPRDGVVHARQ